MRDIRKPLEAGVSRIADVVPGRLSGHNTSWGSVTYFIEYQMSLTISCGIQGVLFCFVT